MSTLSQFVAGGVKSVQRGSISFSVTSAAASISPVDTAKAVVVFGGFRSNDSDFRTSPSVSLASSTSVLASRSASVGTVTVEWQVIEYY